MAETRVPMLLPDLGMQDVPILVGQWLVEVGREVSEGDRILEIVAGSATIDLPAPASGILQETFVAEDDHITVGQELGAIALSNDRDS